MDRYCHSQDSFESNFPPLEFLLEEQQKHEFRSEQYPNHHNVATRLAEDFILETPPSKKMIQKHFLEISSPVTLSKIQFRSTELSKYNEDTYLTPNPRCAVFSTNKSFQKKSTEEHRNVVEPEKIRDSQSLLCNESKFENIIDVDDACSAETTQDNDFSYKNAPVVEGNFGHLNERQQSKFNSSCEHESSKVFDVLQFVGLPRESNEDTIKRVGHEKLWEFALNALLQGKQVIGDEIIYGREDWRKEKLTKPQLVELFGCGNRDLASFSHNTRAHFLGGNGLSTKTTSNKPKWNKVKTRQYPKNKCVQFQRKKFQRKKARN